MDEIAIKLIVQNYNFATIDDIEEILKFIANRKKELLGTDFTFNITLDDGARVLDERDELGRLQVNVGLSNLYDIYEEKYLNTEYDVLEERKIFIETILSTFHELRHVEQINQMSGDSIDSYEVYNMMREKIINESFPGYINSFNYESSYSEIDAMKSSLVETTMFFNYMGSDITKNEVFQVMKEKELKYLNYNLDDFGDTYDSALYQFNILYNSSHEIKGFPEVIKYMSERDRFIFYNECQDLFMIFENETNISKKMDILMEISLIIHPELYDKYPLNNFDNHKKR